MYIICPSAWVTIKSLAVGNNTKGTLSLFLTTYMHVWLHTFIYAERDEENTSKKWEGSLAKKQELYLARE